MAMSKSHKGSSASQNTSVGSSSRPGGSGKHPIKSSAPSHPHKLDRNPKKPMK